MAGLLGEPRKSAIGLAEHAIEEAKEILDQMRMEEQSVPQSIKLKVAMRLRNLQPDLDALQRKLKSLCSDRAVEYVEAKRRSSGKISSSSETNNASAFGRF